MNILMAASRMDIGGAETHVLTLAEELARQGHTVTVASAGGRYAGRLERGGIRHIRLPLDRKNPFALLSALRGLRLAARGADIVHAHGRIPAFVCALLSRRKDFPPFVTTAHGIYSTREPARSLSRWGCLSVAVSAPVARYLSDRYGYPGDRIERIPNGIPLPDAAPAVSAPPEKEAPTVICASGRLEKDTVGLFLALLRVYTDLCAARPGLLLKIAGDGSRRGEVQAAAARVNAKYPGAVLLCGAVTDVPAFLRGADLFAGQSRSAIEAMGNGVCTVLFSGGCCAGVLTAENAAQLLENNYIPAEGADAEQTLQRTLSRLISRPEERTRAAEFARRFVREHNDIRVTAARTADVYRRALTLHRPGILLCGYFGAKNLGDDATLRQALREIRNEIGEVPVFAVTRRPSDVPAGCAGIRRTDFAALRKAMRQSRLFILCGGSLLQNTTSNRSLLYYSVLSRRARAAGCRVQILGGGIGPLRGAFARKNAETVLRGTDAAGLRDPDSLRAAAVCKNAYLSCDAALMLSADAATGPAAAFAVSLRPCAALTEHGKTFASLCACVTALRDASGLSPRYVALSPADVSLCRKAAALTGGSVLVPESAEQAIDAFSGCGFCLGMRLHAVILAAVAGTPSVCLPYDPKVSACADLLGLPRVSLSAPVPAEYVAALSRLPAAEELNRRRGELRKRRETDTAQLRGLYFRTGG